MKDTEKVLKEELSQVFSGQSQRLTMLSKLLISMIKLGKISYSKLSVALNPISCLSALVIGVLPFR